MSRPRLSVDSVDPGCIAYEFIALAQLGLAVRDEWVLRAGLY